MEITELTVHELQEKLRNKELTVSEITKAYVDRINEKEKDVNAFITLLTDEAVEKAKDIEEKISYARQFYNDTVLTYNNLREQFPSNIIASIFKFEKIDFFNADEKDKENPQVKF